MEIFSRVLHWWVVNTPTGHPALDLVVVLVLLIGALSIAVPAVVTVLWVVTAPIGWVLNLVDKLHTMRAARTTYR
jgi:hypothetical protein